MSPFIDIHTHKGNYSKNTICIQNINIALNEKPLAKTIFYSVGIHPWDIKQKEIDQQISILKSLLQEENTLAIGEYGLDKCIQVPLEKQIELFQIQLNIAKDFKIPSILHIVKAWNEIIEIKKQLKNLPPLIIHGFRGKPELAKMLLEHNFFLSFGEKFNPLSLSIAWKENRLFLETDTSKQSIEQIYQTVAQSLSIPIPELTEKIQQNFSKNFFSK